MIEIVAGRLARSMALLSDVVEKRNTVPILANVRLKADKGGLTLEATDLDIWCSDRVDAENRRVKPFETSVLAHKLHEIAKAIPAEAVMTLAIEEGRLSITAQPDLAGGHGIAYTLETLPPDDFPAHVEIEPQAQFELPASELMRTIDAVGFAVSTDETRYYLNGIYLHLEEDRLVAAATDGHRMAMRSLPASEAMADLPNVIVPRKTLRILSRLLAKEKGDVELAVAVRGTRFEIGTVTLYSKNIDGTFPDYSRVVPKPSDCPMLVDPVRLAGAVRRTRVIASEKTRAVRLNAEKSKLAVEVISPENGKAREDLSVDWAGEPLTIGFNAAYLLDMLPHLAAERVEVHLGTPSDPALFRKSADADSVFVLMPMRV
jgi:DNA polymerase III subunit beta